MVLLQRIVSGNCRFSDVVIFNLYPCGHEYQRFINNTINSFISALSDRPDSFHNNSFGYISGLVPISLCFIFKKVTNRGTGCFLLMNTLMFYRNYGS